MTLRASDAWRDRGEIERAITNVKRTAPDKRVRQQPPRAAAEWRPRRQDDDPWWYPGRSVEVNE